MQSISNMPIVEDNVVVDAVNSSVSETSSTDEQKPQQGNEQQEEEANRNLLVTGLSPLMVETELMELFRPFGKVVRVKVTRDIHTGKSRGQGFVLFEQADSAETARKTMNNKIVSGEMLHVYPSRCKLKSIVVQPSKTLFVRNVPKDTPLHAVQEFFTQIGGIVRHCTKHEDKVVENNGFMVVRVKFDKKVKAEGVMEYIQRMKANAFAVYHKSTRTQAPLLVAKYARVFTEQEKQLYRETIAAKRTSGNPSLGDTTTGSSGRTTRSLDSSRVGAPTATNGLLLPLSHPPQPPVNPPPHQPQLLAVLPIIPFPARSADVPQHCLPLPPTAIPAPVDGGLATRNMVLPMPADPPAYTEP